MGVALKKLVGFVLLLLLVAALGAPWIVGFALEREVRGQLAELPANSMVDVSLSEYERGWFSSRVVSKIGFRRFLQTIAQQQARRGTASPDDAFQQLLDDPDSPLDVTFVTIARHGPITSFSRPAPVLARAETVLDPETPGLRELEEMLGVESLFTAEATYELDGLVRSSFETSVIDVGDSSGQAHIAAARMDSTYSLISGQTEMEGVFPLAEFKADSLGGRIENVRWEMAGHLIEDQLFAGTSKASLERMAMTLPDAETGGTNEVEILGLALESETGIDDPGETMSIRQAWRIDSVGVAGQFAMEDAEMVTRIESLDLELMRAWTELSNEIALGATPDDPTEVFAPLGPAFDAALRRSPRIAIDPIRATVGDETFDFAIRIAAEGDRIPAGSALDDPIALIDATNGEIEATVPRWAALQMVRSQVAPQAQAAVEQGQVSPAQAEAWVEQQSAAMLDQYVLQNVVQLSADGYQIQISLADGVVSVNGQPLPIDLKAMLEAAAAAQGDSA